MVSLSLIAVVCNEAKRLPDFIAAHRPLVDEVVLVVQESQDETLWLARQLADTVVEHPRYGYCEASRPAAVAAARGRWLLALDADETLTEYGRILLPYWTAAAVGAYALRRRTTLDGATIEDSTHCRLFARQSVRVPTGLHSCFEPTVPVVVIDGEIVIAHHKTRQEQTDDDARYAVVAEQIQRGYRWL